MSAADLAGPPAPSGPTPFPARLPARRPDPVRAWLRLLRSELGLTFLRWRNVALLGVLAAIPVLLGVALRLAGPSSGGQGPPFLDQVAGNGIFLSFLALTVMLTLVLPLAVAVVAGDSVAGEAGHGTLRYLLTVPAAAAMGALAAIGLEISTLTEHAIAAMAAILVVVIGSEVADSVPQFAVVHPYLPTHWWLSFDALLRAPVAWPTVGHGLLSFAAYAVISGAVAWAQFTTADITS